MLHRRGHKNFRKTKVGHGTKKLANIVLYNFYKRLAIVGSQVT